MLHNIYYIPSHQGYIILRFLLWYNLYHSICFQKNCYVIQHIPTLQKKIGLQLKKCVLLEAFWDKVQIFQLIQDQHLKF